MFSFVNPKAIPDNDDEVDEEEAHIHNLEEAHIRNLEKARLRREWLAKDEEDDVVDEEMTLVEDDVDEEETRLRHEDACRCEEGDVRMCTFIGWALKDGVLIPDAE